MDTPTTKKELAKSYSPNLEPKVAGQHLKRLIHSSAPLMKALRKTRYSETQKNIGQAEKSNIQIFRTSIELEIK